MFFTTDPGLPALERRAILVGTAAIHLLLIAWLLRIAGLGVHGGGEVMQGEGSAMSVTYVTLTRPSQAKPLDATAVISPITPDRKNGPDLETSRIETAAEKVEKALSDSGEQATRADTSQANVRATNQMAAANASPAAKGGFPGEDRLASYHAAVRAAIRLQWAELTDRPFPAGCLMRLNLAAGGPVNSTTAAGCTISREDRLQLEAAALMAQPLPYAGYEAVFVPDLQLVL